MKSSQPLRLALLANAAFSALSGVAFALFAVPLASFVSPGAPPTDFLVVGIGLLLFAMLVGLLGRRARPDPWLALWVSAADLGWVLGSTLLLGLAWHHLAPGGVALIAGVAVIVLSFALAQLRGIGRLYATARAGVFEVCIEVRSAGRADVIWGNLSNFANISRYASALSFSRLRNHAVTQVGAIRECGDHGGRQWAERCTRFDPATREIEIDFLVDEPGNPFPFSQLVGGWQVRRGDAGLGSSVKVWLRGTPKPRLLAPLILPLTDWQSRRTFGPTIQRLAEEPGAPAPAKSAGWSTPPADPP